MKKVSRPIRCVTCKIDLSHMTKEEFEAHMQSKEHVENWMDLKLDQIIKKRPKKEG